MAWWKFPNDIFQDGEVFVVVNLEDYPITAKYETRKTNHNIISALRELGSAGTIKLYAFLCDPEREWRKELNHAGFIYMEPRGYNPGQRNLTDAMVGFLASFGRIEPPENDGSEPRPKYRGLEPLQEPIYVVIAKDRPDSDLYRTLKCLKSRGMQIVLLNPPEEGGSGEYMFPSVKSVIENGKILDGESLVTLSKYPDGFGEENCDYRDNPLGRRSSYHVTDFFGICKPLRNV